MPHNQENWPILTKSDAVDRLVSFGFPEDKARRMESHSVIRLMRRLDARNELLTNAPAEAVVEDMIQHGVELLEVDGAWKMRLNGVAAERWAEGIRPTLRFRRSELIEAWKARTEKPEYRVCRKCLALVYDPEYDGAGCESIFSCPFRSQES